MSWLENNFQHHKIRETHYNKSVCLNKTNLDKITSRFDTIFDKILNFTEEIASLQLYPFKIIPYNNPTGVNVLKTTRGIFNDVNVYNIDYSNYYFNIACFWLTEHFNNFADYKGYTQVKLFLPLLGYVDLDVNEVMGKWIQVRLSVDFFTGKGMYIIGTSEDFMYPGDYPGLSDDFRVISVFECDVGIEIPLGSSNVGDIKRNMLLGAVKVAASAAIATTTGSLPPPTTTTSTVTTYDISARGTAPGSRMKQVQSGTVTTEKTTVHNKPVDKSKPIAEAFDSSIDVLNRNTANGHTDRVNDSGLMWNLSGNAKIIIYRPKLVPVTEDYGKLYGYPLGKVKNLSEITGYTEINSIHFEGVGFERVTKKELALLEEAFADGVIL